MKFIIILLVLSITSYTSADVQWINPLQPNLVTYTGYGDGIANMGEWLVVGAPGDDSDELGMDGIDTGAMHFLFRDHLTQTWSCCSIAKAPDLDRSARFGTG